MLVHRWKTSILASGQAPSQGIEPSRSRLSISAARELTSSNDHRSKAKLKAIEGQIAELAVLQCRLRRLVHVCEHGNGDDCVALHLGTFAEGSGER